MKAQIYCTVSDKGVHSFYLLQDNKRYFLFRQNYRKSVHAYFKQGVSLEEAISFKRIHGDGALAHTMEKLPAYIKYIEKEYQISVYNKTKEKQEKKKAKPYRREVSYWSDLGSMGYGA